MYKVSLRIRQSPGASFMDALRLKKNDELSGWKNFKIDFTVAHSVTIKAHLGLFNNRYIKFTGGKRNGGEYTGTISKGVDGVKITWVGSKPPYTIRRFNFI